MEASSKQIKSHFRRIWAKSLVKIWVKKYQKIYKGTFVEVCSSNGRESVTKSIGIACHIFQEDICMIHVDKLQF